MRTISRSPLGFLSLALAAALTIGPPAGAFVAGAVLTSPRDAHASSAHTTSIDSPSVERAPLVLLAQNSPMDTANAALSNMNAQIARDFGQTMIAQNSATDAPSLDAPSLAATAGTVELAGDAQVKAAIAMLFDGIARGNLWIVAAGLLSLAVYLLRRFVPWFSSDVGGVLAVVLLGFAGAFVHALLAGAPLSVAALAGLKVTLSSAGLFAMLRRIFGASKIQEAERAGETAATAASIASPGAAGIVGTPRPFGKVG